MSRRFSRRSFLSSAVACGMVPAVTPGHLSAARPDDEDGPLPSGMPVVISSGNGLRATERARGLLADGVDTLDAVIAGVNIIEEDPADTSVGYGGLPNEEGVVQLDSCCMHGPSYNAGAVASIEKIKTPSKVARLVMSRTDHVLLVGDGALRFAIAHGFQPEDLLTDQARQAWLRWKENLSDKDDWLSPEDEKRAMEARHTGTITCLALNARGDLSGVTTTSGLSFKLPGRVGDSPIIGAGLYVDNEVGACGATGRGEAVIIAGGSRIVVENMRHEMDPRAAIRDVLKRIVHQTVDPRLRDAAGRPAFNVAFYAVDKSGRYASGSLWSGPTFAVHDGKENRLEKCFALFHKES